MTELSLSPFSRALNARPNGVEIVPFDNRETWLSMRERDVTASIAGALLGIHPYMTAYSLFHIKLGNIENHVESDPVISGDKISFPPAARGNSFEPLVAQHLRLLRPDWMVDYPLNRYWRITEDRIGCTPDSLVVDPERAGFGVVQFKTTSDFFFDKTWLDPDTRDVVIPLWIAVQAMVEAKVTGASWAAVAVMMTGMRTETILISIPLHNGVWERIRAEVAKFWSMVKTGSEPAPDYARDAASIAEIYAESDGTIKDIGVDFAVRMGELLTKREALKTLEAEGNAAARDRKVVDSEIIYTLGNSEAGRLPDGRIINARTVKRAGYAVEPSSYRTVKIKGLKK